MKHADPAPTTAATEYAAVQQQTPFANTDYTSSSSAASAAVANPLHAEPSTDSINAAYLNSLSGGSGRVNTTAPAQTTGSGGYTTYTGGNDFDDQDLTDI